MTSEATQEGLTPAADPEGQCLHCSCGNADGQQSAFSEEWQCGEGNTVGSNEKCLGHTRGSGLEVDPGSGLVDATLA